MDYQVTGPTTRRRRLHMVFLVRSFGFPEGMAATNRVRLLGRALIEQNADVSVYCLRVSEVPPEVRNRERQGTCDGIVFLYTPGTTVRSRSFTIRRYRDALGYVRALLKLARLRHENRLDCVYLADGGAQTWRASVWLLLRWLRILGVPVITELNEMPASIHWLPDWLSRRLSHLDGVSAVVAISRWLADWAATEADRIRRPVHIIEVPVVVDVDEHESASETREGCTFVYSAMGGYVHDLRFILRAMDRVWQRWPDCRVTVTGMSPDLVASAAMSENLEKALADGRIVAPGYVERTHLLSLYRSAVALLIPLHDDDRSRARFPTKIGEYLASRRPVVTTRVGEIDRFLSDGRTAYIAAADNVDAYSAKMLEALDDPVQASIVGAGGRRVAEACLQYSLQGPRLTALMVELSSGPRDTHVR